MKYTKLGRRGPKVSTIGFGAWAIGGMNWGKTDDEVSKNALRKAIENGVTFIDTADVYGFGHSENLVREVIEEMGEKNNIVVATKAGNDFYNTSSDDDLGYGPIKQNANYDYIIYAAEQSLKRLNIEAIDILQLHSPEKKNYKKMIHGKHLKHSKGMVKSNMLAGVSNHFRKPINLFYSMTIMI